MGEESRYGARDIKKIVWTGPVAETDNGSLKFGVVGRTKGNSLKAGHGTISAGSVRRARRWNPRLLQMGA